jgi:hypothetical protein
LTKVDTSHHVDIRLVMAMLPQSGNAAITVSRPMACAYSALVKCIPQINYLKTTLFKRKEVYCLYVITSLY